MAGNRPGPDPKGDRAQISLRLPRTHHQLYTQQAAQAGLSLGDYCMSMLADAHELPQPAYVDKWRKTPTDHDQDALPLGA